MKNENTIRWAEELRTTDKLQGPGLLHRIHVGPQGTETHEFCCLGIGCEVAGITQDVVQEDAHETVIGYSGVSALPPREFYDWLGIDAPSESRLFLDAPGYPLLDDEESLGTVALDEWNDNGGLTFRQIGDLIAYFGVTTEVTL